LGASANPALLLRERSPCRRNKLERETGTVTYHLPGTFSGGTGRFVNAEGPFEDNGTATVLVLDPQGHAFGNITSTLTGTLTGVGDGGD
jgi:hypothetical protein